VLVPHVLLSEDFPAHVLWWFPQWRTLAEEPPPHVALQAVQCSHALHWANKMTDFCKYVTQSGKIQIMEEQKEKALLRRRAFFAASDQRLDFLSHMST